MRCGRQPSEPAAWQPVPTTLRLGRRICWSLSCASGGLPPTRPWSRLGLDLGRLRTSALNLALGLVACRRVEKQPEKAVATQPPARTSEKKPTGVVIPLIPPRPKPAREARPAPAATSEVTTKPVAEPKPLPRRQPRAATERFELDPARCPTLSSLGKNLTLAAARGELDPVVGRDNEIEQTLDAGQAPRQ